MKHCIKIAILLSLFLSACGNENNIPEKRSAVLASKYPKATIVVVSGTGTFLARQIKAAVIKSGVTSVIDSTNADTIVNLLSNTSTSTKVVVAVIGNDDNIASATLERALQVGKKKIMGSKVVFVGNPKYKGPLSKAASESGVQIEFIDYP